MKTPEEAIIEIRRIFSEDYKTIHPKEDNRQLLSTLLKMAQQFHLNEYIHCFKGLKNWRDADYEKAIIALNKAIEIDDAFAYPWNGLGQIFREQKQ